MWSVFPLFGAKLGMEGLFFFFYCTRLIFHVRFFWVSTEHFLNFFSRSLSFFYHRTCNNIFWVFFSWANYWSIWKRLFSFLSSSSWFRGQYPGKAEEEGIVGCHSILFLFGNEHFSKQYKGKFHWNKSNPSFPTTILKVFFNYHVFCYAMTSSPVKLLQALPHWP